MTSVKPHNMQQILPVFFFALSLAAQSPLPSQIGGLTNSTTIWSPYAESSMPDWGASYTDTNHTSWGTPLSITRLQNINPDCNSYRWSTNVSYRPNLSITYKGGWYYVPYSAGVRSKANFSFTTSAATAAGGNVLNFAATTGLAPGFGFAVTGTNIPDGTTVSSFDSTTVTLSANVKGSGVGSGETVTFSNAPNVQGVTQAPWVKASQAETCSVRSLVPSYSMRQAWNLDQSEFYVFSAGGGGAAYFYRNTSPLAFDFEFVSGSFSSTNGDETWSHSDPGKIVWMNNTLSPPQMQQLDITTKTVSKIHTYDITGAECPSGTHYVNNGGSGNPSSDDRYWAQGCSANGITTTTRIIVYDKVLDSVVSQRDITAICGAPQPIDWLGMSPSGNWIIVAWASATPYEDTWTTCRGVELFDRATITSQGMIFSTDSHNDVGYDANGYEVMVAPHCSRLVHESNSGYWSMTVTRLSDVHAPPYGTTTATSYVRRYLMPCTFYSALSGTDPYTGCTGSSANGINYWHVSGRAAENLDTYGLFLISTYAYNQNPAAEQAGWGRSENFVASIDSTWPSQIVMTTSAQTPSGNVLHFASTAPTGGLYTLLAGGQMYVSGTHIADNTTITSFGSTSVTLSNDVTGSVSSGAPITFFMHIPFRRISRTAATRYGGTLAQCTGGDDYWQEPHSTVNRTFTQILFASSWLSQCGQIGAFYVNLPGYHPAMPVMPPRNANNHVFIEQPGNTQVRRP
jgi:hypothetical protein